MKSAKTRPTESEKQNIGIALKQITKCIVSGYTARSWWCKTSNNKSLITLDSIIFRPVLSASLVYDNMNNLTTSPVAQTYEHAGPSRYIGKGRYTDYHSEEHDRFRCLNHRYGLDRLTLDLNSDASVTGKLDSIDRLWHAYTYWCMARMNDIYSKHVCYI